MQQIVGGGFNLWQAGSDVDGTPLVLAPYYAQPYIADFIGMDGNTQVLNIPVSGLPDSHAAYVSPKSQKRRAALWPSLVFPQRSYPFVILL